jgi:hypothetical protein
MVAFQGPEIIAPFCMSTGALRYTGYGRTLPRNSEAALIDPGVLKCVINSRTWWFCGPTRWPTGPNTLVNCCKQAWLLKKSLSLKNCRNLEIENVQATRENRL